jgi:hypothetical protein
MVNCDVDTAAHVRSEESWRADTDDPDRHVAAVECEALAHHVGRAAESPPPERVTDHGDGAIGTAAALVIRLGERPLQHGLHAEGGSKTN